MLYGKARKSEQRREALIAKMNVDAELLLGKPSLARAAETGDKNAHILHFSGTGALMVNRGSFY